MRSVETDQTTAALWALTEHREDLVRTRTQTVNRLHVLLAQLLPAGGAANLTADSAAALLRTVRASPRDAGPHAAPDRGRPRRRDPAPGPAHQRGR
ncbi:hypothetical protein [Micromonospora sp. HB375]|uniref:hypothetical protein n=1 Tax=Micromonospora sp. HB375 TaxID=767364 RepID=UPI0035A9AA7F